jgi:hypothetical protein
MGYKYTKEQLIAPGPRARLVTAEERHRRGVKGVVRQAGSR